jgi:lysophospholipase L1-like esterase
MLVLFIVVPAIAAFIYTQDLFLRIVIFLIIVVVLLLVIEVAFRLLFRIFYGLPYVSMPAVPFRDFYVEPHPYIPYVYKGNAVTEKKEMATYPLHKGKYYFGQYNTNSLGFLNGTIGNTEIEVPKPDGLYRIACLGASTTGNYIVAEGKSYSYPLELESILKGALGESIEVNNFGQGGYNSADILVRFILQIIDTKPDMVVIYHAYNDIRAYLTPGFLSDYSHSRRNLGESYWKFFYTAKIPSFPLKFVNFLIDKWTSRRIRNSLIEQISIGTIDPNQDTSMGLATYRRNLKHIIDICRNNNIDVVLSTYCHYLHNEIINEPLHQLHSLIVREENEIIRNLAKEHQLMLVDNAVLVPMEERYFVDSIHFTPEGMHMIAANIAEVALKKIVITAKKS